MDKISRWKYTTANIADQTVRSTPESDLQSQQPREGF